MATFELALTDKGSGFKILSKAVFLASKISREILIEFKKDEMLISTRDDIYYIEFSFNSHNFFTTYSCDKQHACYVNSKGFQLAMKVPFSYDKDALSCNPNKLIVTYKEGEKLKFEISTDTRLCCLTHKLIVHDDHGKIKYIKDIGERRVEESVRIRPHQSDKFLSSALKDFAPEIKLITFQIHRDEKLRCIGSSDIFLAPKKTTSEFCHSQFHECFVNNQVVGDHINITIKITHLKMFLIFVEQHIKSMPQYVFEGVGKPAHFIYEDDSHVFSCRFVTSSREDFSEFDEAVLPIEYDARESFIMEEDVIQIEDPLYDNNNISCYDIEENLDGVDDEDGFNDNKSDAGSELLDSDLERVNFSRDNDKNSTITESIRNEMRYVSYDPRRIFKLLNLDKDPDAEMKKVVYYPDSDEDSDV